MLPPDGNSIPVRGCCIAKRPHLAQGRLALTPVREKVSKGRAGEPGLGAPLSPRREHPVESREGNNRRAGILLIVIGCVLMALAAGEAAAVTSPVADQRAAAQTSTILAP